MIAAWKAAQRAWAWVRDHLWLFLAVGVAYLVWVVTRGRRDPKAVVARERQVVDAKAEARRAEADLGAEQAAEKIKADYAEKLKQLDAAQKEKADALASDPESLVEHLLRATS